MRTKANVSARGLVALVLAAAAIAIAFVLLGGQHLGGFLAPAAPEAHRAHVYSDDSGYVAARRFMARRLDDYSFQVLRECFENAGHKGMKLTDAVLARTQRPASQMDSLLLLAKLALYESDHVRADGYLKRARALAESCAKQERNNGAAAAVVKAEDPRAAASPDAGAPADPVPVDDGKSVGAAGGIAAFGAQAAPTRAGHVGDQLSTILFLQAINALRQGETENCIQHQCRTSCIVPIDQAAVHNLPEGSRRAQAFLLEYLELNPEDMGARWLLNVCHMTLGTYPAKVDPRYVIPTTIFRSEMDIGRFVDIGPQTKVNRLDQSGGAVMDDFDNDGMLDIVESCWDPTEHMVYLHATGDGTFEDRSKAAGLEPQLGGFTVVQTDYNNDGYLDLWVSRGGLGHVPMRPSLLRNNRDGTFTDVTKEARLTFPVASLSSTWGDFNNDGWLDFFICSEGARSRLYQNLKDGTFEEVALKAGVDCMGSNIKGANWGDFDGDGFPDLYASAIGSPPRLYHNNQNGTFTDVAEKMGITLPLVGFSCFWLDHDNDGFLDLFAASYDQDLDEAVRDMMGLPHSLETVQLHRNIDGKRFENVTRKVGLAHSPVVMGSNFFDADNDGYLDLYLGTGAPPYSMLLPNRFYRNMEGQRFSDITFSSGTGHLQKTHQIACGDWDRDGNVDMYVQIGGATPGDRFRNVLFQNPGHSNHWVTIKLIGKQTNRAAIGARIKVTVAAVPQNGASPGGQSGASPGGSSTRDIYRTVTSGSSFGANCLQQTIGLGSATSIASVEVNWPVSHTTQIFKNVSIDQAIEITESESGFRPLKWTKLPVPR